MSAAASVVLLCSSFPSAPQECGSVFQRADWSHGRRGGSAGKIQEAALGAPNCACFFDCICCSLIIWTGCSVERRRSQRYKATAAAKCLPGSCLVGKMERDKKKRGGKWGGLNAPSQREESPESPGPRPSCGGSGGASSLLVAPPSSLSPHNTWRWRRGGGRGEVGGRGRFHPLSASPGLVLLLPWPGNDSWLGSSFLINRYSAVQCRDSRTKTRPSVAWLRSVTQQDAEASLRRLFLWAVYMLDW